MDIRHARHDPALWSALWPTTPEQARSVQDRLRGAVETADRFGPLHRIAALDAHYGAEGTVTWAAAALLAVPGLELMRSALVAQPTRFPYVPGLLSFREAPAMIDALEMLGPDPDLLPDLLLV